MQSPGSEHDPTAPGPDGLQAKLCSLAKGRAGALWQLVEATRAFLEKALQGNLAELDSFQSQRSRLFECLAIYDRQLEQCSSALAASDLSPETRAVLSGCLEEAKRLAEGALHADRLLESCLREARARVLDQLGSARRGQTALSRFKSQWISEAGEGLDRTL